MFLNEQANYYLHLPIHPLNFYKLKISVICVAKL